MPKGVFSTITCDKCGKDVKSNAFNRHATKSCGRVIEKRKRVAWNKGLDTSDPRVKNLGNSISKSLTGIKRGPLSEKQKLQLSVLQSERLKNGYADGSRQQAGGYCKWYDVDGVKVQGSWEFRTVKILTKLQQLGEIRNWSRCPHRIPYIVNGEVHTYSPDFEVERINGTKFILEVKGRQSLIDDIKWNAAKAASFDLIVWRLKDIEDNEQELKNKEKVTGSIPVGSSISNRSITIIKN